MTLFWRKTSVPDHARTGSYLRAKRESAKISLRAMSAKMGIDPAVLCRLETGKQAWSEARVEAFTLALREARL
jgi:transcriptional regulator with XRE-family HTH domain